MRLAGWLLAPALLVGCAADPARCPCEAAAARGANTVVALQDNLSFPYRLSQLAVSLDGEPLFIRRFEPDRLDRPRELGALALRSGPHTLTVRALVSYASTELDADDGCEVELRTQDRFVVASTGSQVLVDVFAVGDVTRRFIERPRLAIRLDGAVRARGDERVRSQLGRPVGELAATCRDDGPLVADDFPYPFDDRQQFTVYPQR